MIDTVGWGVERWAFHLTHLLNAANPPNRHCFDVGELAKEVSRNFFPDDPISQVVGDDLDGFDGALIPSESGKKWGILFDRKASPQRRRFTIGHELGHYLLHRVKYPSGIHSDEAAVDGRNGVLIEQQASTIPLASGSRNPCANFHSTLQISTPHTRCCTSKIPTARFGMPTPKSKTATTVSTGPKQSRRAS
jgi:hypothetical protein